MPRPRAWDDKGLRDAVSESSTWKETCERLGVPVGGKTVQILRRRADELGLDYRAFYGAGLRGTREAYVDDDTLREFVASSSSWSDLARRFGYVTILRGKQQQRISGRIAALGISTAHFRGRGFNGLVPFTSGHSRFGSPPDPKRLRFAALGNAIAWFSERGYVVSTPVEPAVYDLLVDAAADGIFKVQVKSSASPKRAVGFARTVYDRERPGTESAGYMRRAPYEASDVDFFFVVLSDGSKFLIPYDVIGHRVSARVGARYEEFRIA